LHRSALKSAALDRDERINENCTSVFFKNTRYAKNANRFIAQLFSIATSHFVTSYSRSVGGANEFKLVV